MPIINKKYEAGDVTFWSCPHCNAVGIPADTRVVGKYQYTECIPCGRVYKIRVNKNSRADIQWHRDYKQKIDKSNILKVEMNSNGIAIKIIQGDMVNYEEKGADYETASDS